MIGENDRTEGKDVGEEIPMTESFYESYLTLTRNALGDFEQKLSAAGDDKRQIIEACRSIEEGPFITLANELKLRGEATEARTIALFVSDSRKRLELLPEVKKIIEEGSIGQ